MSDEQKFVAAEPKQDTWQDKMMRKLNQEKVNMQVSLCEAEVTIDTMNVTIGKLMEKVEQLEAQLGKPPMTATESANNGATH